MSRVPIAENYPQGNLTIGVTAEQERWRGAGAASAAGTSLQNARPGCIASPKVSASNSIYARVEASRANSGRAIFDKTGPIKAIPIMSFPVG